MTSVESDVKVGSVDVEECELDLLESLLGEVSEINDTKNIVSGNEPSSSSQGIERDAPNTKKHFTSIHSGDTDSSDDEDNRYFENQKYNESGRNIKKMLNSNEDNKRLSFYLGDSKVRNNNVTWKSKIQSGSQKLCTTQQKLDVYTDPVFGIRMINPLVTSRQLQEKMVGRTAVSMATIKRHIANGGTESDWVIAGVIVQKSPIRTSQKGSQYCVWKISDLKDTLKTVSVFFFRNSHKNLWKTAVGTVIGILNSRIMEDSKDGDEATLAVDNAQKVMVLGVSKDYGICKAKKKNGEDCTAFVNANKCTYCIYHVQQAYKKCSRRSELQSPSLGRGLNTLRNKVLGKNEVFYGGQSFMAVPATTNKKQFAKDKEKLKKLTQTTISTSSFMKRQEAKQQHYLKDRMLLSSLKERRLPTQTDEDKVLQDGTSKLNSKPQLSKSADVDLSSPVNKFLINRAKLTALQWVKKNGKLNRDDPNEVRKKDCSKKRHNSSSPEERSSKIRKIDKTDGKSEESTKPAFSSRFMELLNTKSKHIDLVEATDANAQDEYFNSLEKKEKMEEKMLTTYKVPCKAVKCLKCKYTAFSASDLCKSERHPLKVIDAVKRFFRCKDCNNRTTTLELIPLLTCKQCSGSQWERAPMMKERKGNNMQVQPLSIRGGEEKFLGSPQMDGNLNLLVPE